MNTVYIEAIFLFIYLQINNSDNGKNMCTSPPLAEAPTRSGAIGLLSRQLLTEFDLELIINFFFSQLVNIHQSFHQIGGTGRNISEYFLSTIMLFFTNNHFGYGKP